MKLTLVSTDVVLPTLCREILAEFGGSRFEMTTSDPHGTVVSDSDLYVWDLDPLQRVPRARFPVEQQRHFFLVRPTDVDLLQQFGVTAGVDVILLKPVTRATLRAFLGQAVAHSTERASLEGKIGSLRMEREEILQRLLQANLKLQEYDQQRTNFLARIAHDIRTPLTSVAGFCGLLLSEHLGALTPEQADVLGRMQYSTKRLSRLTDGLFRLSLGKPCDNRANLQKGDIRECVSQAVAEILQISQQRRLSIAVGEMLPADGLYFERGQIEQVLLNLLENACKFAPAGGEIEIRGYPFFWERRSTVVSPQPAERRRANSPTHNSYRIDVKDSGPGVAPGRLDSIFEEFTSYSEGQDRAGGGLGLAICKRILAEHHGRIWAEADLEGTRFSFVIPRHGTESRKRVAEIRTAARADGGLSAGINHNAAKRKSPDDPSRRGRKRRSQVS